MVCAELLVLCCGQLLLQIQIVHYLVAQRLLWGPRLLLDANADLNYTDFVLSLVLFFY